MQVEINQYCASCGPRPAACTHKSTSIGLELEHSAMRPRVHPERIGQTVSVYTDQDLKDQEDPLVGRIKSQSKCSAVTYRSPSHNGDLVLHRPFFENLYIDFCQTFPLDLIQLEHEFSVRFVGQSPSSLLSRDVGDDRNLGIRSARLGGSNGYGTLVAFEKTFSEGFQPVFVYVHSESVSPGFEGGGGSLVPGETVGEDDGIE